MSVAVCLASVVCSADDRPLQPETADVPRGQISFAAFSPTGDQVATVSEDHTIRLWNTEDCQLLWKASSPDDGVERRLQGVAFSPDGKTVAAVRINSKAKCSALLWKVADGQLDRQLDVGRSSGSPFPTSLRFSADGQALRSSAGTFVYHWDITSGRMEVKQIPGVLHGRIWFAAGNKPYITSGLARLHVHDATTGRAVFTYDREQLVWGDLYDGSRKFVGITAKRSLLLGDSATRQESAHLTPLTGTVAWARMAHTSDTLILYTASVCLERWDLEKQRCTGVLERPVGIVQSYVDTPVLYGKPQLQALYVYHPTRMLISSDDSQAFLLSGRRFALVPLDWQPPPEGSTGG